MVANSSFETPASQRGVVLVVTLIALLLVTIVTFAALRSSTLNVRIATAQEVKSTTFQAAESGINLMAQSTNTLGPPEETAAPEVYDWGDALMPVFRLRGADTASTADDVLIQTRGTATFRREAAAAGYSIRKGSAGFQTFHYELTTEARTDGEMSTQSRLAQGVFIEAPRVN